MKIPKKQINMKNYKTWLKTAAIFQLITAAMHTATLFVNQPPKNDTEKQLFELMNSYKFDFGAGFHRTMNELTLALSSSLSLLCLFASLTLLFLMKKRVDTAIMKGIVNLNLIVFGTFFIITLSFTFLVPITQFGLVLLFLILSRITIAKTIPDKLD